MPFTLSHLPDKEPLERAVASFFHYIQEEFGLESFPGGWWPWATENAHTASGFLSPFHTSVTFM